MPVSVGKIFLGPPLTLRCDVLGSDRSTDWLVGELSFGSRLDGILLAGLHRCGICFNGDSFCRYGELMISSR